MANPFSKLKKDLLAEEEASRLVQPLPEIPMEQRNDLEMQKPSPIDVQMLQQQMAPQASENELAMMEAPQVAGMFDSTSQGGMAGGFGSNPTADQQRREKALRTRQLQKDSINKEFKLRDDEEGSIFKKLRKALRPGTEY